MVKLNIELLIRIKTYIENTEMQIESEWGNGRSLSDIIQNRIMPDEYYELCKVLEENEQ